MDKIIKIPRNRWKQDLGHIFSETFDSDLPDENHADIYGIYGADGKVKAFINVESVKFIGQIFSADNSDRQTVKKLVNYVVDILPDGISVAAVASETRFEALFRLFRMHRISGTLFRRNL